MICKSSDKPCHLLPRNTQEGILVAMATLWAWNDISIIKIEILLCHGRVSRGIISRTSYRVLLIKFCLHVSMVVLKNLSGFTPTAILGLGLYRMETCVEKSVILSPFGASHDSATNDAALCSRRRCTDVSLNIKMVSSQGSSLMRPPRMKPIGVN